MSWLAGSRRHVDTNVAYDTLLGDHLDEDECEKPATRNSRERPSYRLISFAIGIAVILASAAVGALVATFVIKHHHSHQHIPSPVPRSMSGDTTIDILIIALKKA